MKSMQTVIKMKTFLVIISFICVLGQSGQSQLPQKLCENNFGNIKISEAFRYDSNMFFFGVAGDDFKLTQAHWDSTQNKLTFESWDWLSTEWNDTDNLRLITTVNYPGKGKRILKMDKGKV